MEEIQYIILENSTLDIIAVIVSIISVIATIVLTVYTICQNTILNKKQHDLQLHIQKRQEIDNATALKLSNRQYAEKVYEICFEIFAFSELLSKFSSFIKIKTYDQCRGIFDGVFKLYPNIEKDSRYLIIGQHYLTNSLDSTVREVRDAFDALMQEITIFRVNKEILTKDEMTSEYQKSLDNIYLDVKRIEKTKKTMLFMIETQFKL